MGSIERAFDGPVNSCVKKWRYLIIFLGLGLAAFSGYKCTELQGLASMEQYFKADHEVTLAFSKVTNDFNEGTQGQSIIVDIMWGVVGIDKEGVDFFNASDVGKAIWDYEFDLSEPEAQQDAFDFCLDLRQLDELLYQEESVTCWIEDFRRWLGNINEAFPVPKDRFLDLVSRYARDTPDGRDHRRESDIGFIDGQLVFMKFTAKSSGGLYDPYARKSPVRDAWVKVLSDFNAKAHPGVNKTVQTAGLDWCMMTTELRLVETMQTGLWMSILFALCTLVLATGNLIVATLAALTIALIIISVVAVVPLSGWQLGSAESVGCVVCVGFAVDYVVHLGGHYAHSKYRDREARIREALREMGVSILSGSVTTVLSVLILPVAVIMVFTKFAILVIATVTLSSAYSLCFFAACMHAFGPSGTTANIGSILRLCSPARCRKSKQQDALPEDG
jgi:hypothetical protein